MVLGSIPRILTCALFTAFVLAIAAACGGGGSSPSSTSSPQLGAIAGVAPPLVPFSDSWPQYTNPRTSLSLRYPPTWQAITSPAGQAATLYPPGSDPSLPSPAIAFEVVPDKSYGTRPIITDYITDPKTLTINALTGRQYEDTEFAIPQQSSYVEFPDGNGLLLITTTKGPNVNLVPELQEILKGLSIDH
jgi:hypothetical protein